MSRAPPPREHKDHAFRALFEHLDSPSPRVFGVPCPARVEVLPPVIPQLDTRAVVVDGLLQAPEDGSIWTLEFEMGRPDAGTYGRLIQHHVAVAREYRDHRVETVVLWGAILPPDRDVRCGQASLQAHQVFLPAMDGEAVIRRIQDQVQAGRPLGSPEILLLATCPLMHHEVRPWTVLERAVPLAQGLGEERRREVVTAMGTLAYTALDPAERPFLLEVLKLMALGNELFEDLRREGRLEGELRNARLCVLDLFNARFHVVPPAVRAEIARTDDPARLHTWLLGIGLAKDANEAARLICGHP